MSVAPRVRRSGALLGACAVALAAASLTALPAGAEGGAEGGTELVKNGSFDSGTDSWFAPDGAAVDDGRLCVDVKGGTTNPWDVIVGQNGIPVQKGASYTLTFEASGTPSGLVRALVGRNTGDYATVFEKSFTDLTGTAKKYEVVGTSSIDLPAAEGQVAFQIGGSSTDWRFCVDNVSLLGAAPPAYVPDTGSRVRVNQVGYLPYGPKQATLVTAKTTPVTWQLKKSGKVVTAGKSRPAGVNESSGLNVHVIDFSKYTKQGSGFTLVADGQTSYPFAINDDAYEKLRVDALSWFYPQRSGVQILGAVAGHDPLTGLSYARAAGHLGVAPNQGDTEVGCQTEQTETVNGVNVYGEPWTCDYTLDVSGGWYDAGDHGKYVVNGGIAVAQLLGEFERTKTSRYTQPAKLGDATLRVPERGNGVPDILDEARWELEWMLKMQVPTGEPLAGMVHHKVHDYTWTGLPLRPADDPKLRELHRPSTAATLNLAAVAAQGARLFAPYDRAFATKLIRAAQTAYAAAKAHPALYAPAADGNNGGGAYDDTDVTDEFYWAAAELYLTTGLVQYRNDVLNSAWHRADVFSADGFDWKHTAALGRLDLATVPNRLPDRARVRASVLAGADKYLKAQSGEPFGQAYAPTDGVYAWGSNNLILNTMVVMATAYDLSGRTKYRNGVLTSMDYLFGRNALNESYVTDYGSKFSQNEHSRLYANQLNPEFPHPPAGSLSGGPNSDSGTWDPTWAGLAARMAGGTCAPQLCHVDDVQSWATNEVAINWNSTLSWVAGFIADQNDAERR